MENKKFKPTVAGKIFMVQDGDESLFYIEQHDILPDYFWVYNMSHPALYGFKKTTVWEQIDKKQWILQPPKQ